MKKKTKMVDGREKDKEEGREYLESEEKRRETT